jgi:L-threonylcarbamoyladenylate synthase
MVVPKDDSSAHSLIRSALGNHGVVVMPCDTIYGIVGSAPWTEERIRSIKGRGETKPFLRLIPSAEAMSEYTDLALDERIALFWPGPLTVIVPWRRGGTVALRVPQDPLLIGLMQELETHLFSTSVNRSGSESLWRITEIVEEFEHDVDLIVSSGDLEGRLPSTILDVTSRPYQVLRQGALVIPDALLGT